MRFAAPIPVTTIAGSIGATLYGDTTAAVSGINEIHRVEPGDLAFVDHPKYYDACLRSAATFIIIDRQVSVPEGKTLLVVDNPFEAYQRIVQQYRPFEPLSGVLSDTADVGTGTVIMPGAVIGHHVRIGRDCIIYPNVTILSHCIIGDRVIIQAGTVIGSDAFYYSRKTERPGHYRKMLSCGRVVIADDVEIGANCSIDRGISSDTVIGAGTKLDNQVHIGHDTVIGRNCLFAAQVGIAGATTIGDGVILWGQVGVNKTLHIGDGAVVYAQSGVKDSIPGGKIYFGTPVEEAREKMKELVWVKRIPQLWEKVMGGRKERDGHSGS